MKTQMTKTEAHDTLGEAFALITRVLDAHRMGGENKLPLTEDQLRHLTDGRHSISSTITALARQIQHPQHFEDLP